MSFVRVVVTQPKYTVLWSTYPRKSGGVDYCAHKLISIEVSFDNHTQQVETLLSVTNFRLYIQIGSKKGLKASNFVLRFVEKSLLTFQLEAQNITTEYRKLHQAHSCVDWCAWHTSPYSWFSSSNLWISLIHIGLSGSTLHRRYNQ